MKEALIGIFVGAGLLAGAAYAGMQYERREHERELAEAKAEFALRLGEAATAYANQKVIDDAELKVLRDKAKSSPPDKTVAFKKDSAKRIGAIK